jgi:hypothetical protein
MKRWPGPQDDPRKVAATGCLHGILVTAVIALLIFTLVTLTGCGSRTTATKAIDSVTKTTEIAVRQVLAPTGEVITLTDKITTFTESVSTEQAESETKIVPPPIVEMIQPALKAAAGATGFGGALEIAGGIGTLVMGAFAGKKALEANKSKKAVRLVADLADKFADAETDEEVEEAKKAAATDQERAGVRDLIDRARGRI